jgi:hypothetical protein
MSSTGRGGDGRAGGKKRGEAIGGSRRIRIREKKQREEAERDRQGALDAAL